jgi:hypothetical protein
MSLPAWRLRDPALDHHDGLGDWMLQRAYTLSLQTMVERVQAMAYVCARTLTKTLPSKDVGIRPSTLVMA